jgi:preprotein translocase subunit YajC
VTEAEARKLKTGDKVVWVDGSKGEVIDAGYAGVRIGWDDGQYSIVQFDDTGGLRSKLRKDTSK